jgi:RND family efflux transporter MFP subunit
MIISFIRKLDFARRAHRHSDSVLDSQLNVDISLLFGFLLSIALSQLISACDMAPREKINGGSQTSADTVGKDSARKPVQVAVEVTKAVNVKRFVIIPGIVSSLPDHSIKISPAIAGKLVSVFVVPGQHVSRNQLIAKLDDRHILGQIEQSNLAIRSAQSLVSQAENNLSFAKENLERTRKLFAAEVVAKKDILLAENQLQAAQAQLLADQTQVTNAQGNRRQLLTEKSYTEVRSPISGSVANRFLNAGDSADLNTPIAQIVQLDRVVVNASLPSDSSEKLKVGEHAIISSIADAQSKFDAVITSISPIVDAQTNTIRVQLECLNKGMELREGQAVTVKIWSALDRNQILISKSALVPNPEHPDDDMVYTVVNGKAKRVPVKKGATEGENIEILSGLTPGQSIISKGAYGLPDDSLVEPVGSSDNK